MLRKVRRGLKRTVPPEQATQQAINDEVRRVRALPADEFAKIGAAFTDAESIFEALEVADGRATVLLRASWLRTLDPARGDRLPKRGDGGLPPEALIGAEELRAIHAAATGRAGRRQAALPLIAVSHMWLSKV